MNTVSERLSPLLIFIVRRLVDGRYDELERDSGGQRIPAADLQRVIARYGGSLVMPPLSAFADVEAVRVEGRQPPTWSVYVDLWTLEEGRSDLTLQCTVHEKPDRSLGFSLDDLLVR